MTMDAISSLRAALERDPHDATLRMLLVRALRDAGELEDAVDEVAALAESDALPAGAAAEAGRIALEAGRLDVAGACARAAMAGDPDAAGTRLLVADLEAALRDGVEEARVDADRARRIQAEAPSPPPGDEPAAAAVTFDMVGGLADAKRAIERAVILPYRRPDLYAEYGRRSGGGALLFGPPGCGKTMLARATAGECGLPFFAIRIEEVLGPYIGESERNLHGMFEAARAAAPCVLFIDELDALAYSRSKGGSFSGRTLTNTLLEELDAIGSDNDGILVLGATNAPWDVDDALRRPGRFDRELFVPPPDEATREVILTLLLDSRRSGRLDLRAIARSTPLYSGADLRVVVEDAIDLVIDEALDSGGTPPIEQHHLERALAQRRPTTIDWLAAVRNYVDFANDSGRYDDVQRYLDARETRRAIKRAT